jgi:hypothetical protein
MGIGRREREERRGDKTRQDKTVKDKTRQDHHKTRQEETRQYKTRQEEVCFYERQENETRQDRPRRLDKMRERERKRGGLPETETGIHKDSDRRRQGGNDRGETKSRVQTSISKRSAALGVRTHRRRRCTFDLSSATEEDSSISAFLWVVRCRQ